MKDIASSTLRDLAAAIRRRELTSVEALDAHLACVEQHNVALNAVVMLDAERARERARQADESLGRGEPPGPLHGVPFALKDCHDVAGMPSTAGAAWWKQHRPGRSSPVVERLLQAGAVLFGRTNVAELLADFQCANPVFGRTSNPWNPECTSGGSSGGAAAAIAAGMTPFDIGTDLSGSIRLPAAYCGVFGLKPTEHRVPLTGAFPNPQCLPRPVRAVSCIGPMARSVGDLALLLDIIEGLDLRDPDVPPAPPEEEARPQLKGLRVACITQMGALPVSFEVEAAIHALAQRLEREGAIVSEAQCPRTTDELQGDLAALGELIAMMTGAFQAARDAKRSKPTLEAYLSALDRRDSAIAAWNQFLQHWDVLLCPVSATTAFTHREAGTPIEVDGRPVPYFAVSAHSAIFNYSGQPALALPCARSSDGLPIGAQLVGRSWGDRRLLAIAALVSSCTDYGVKRRGIASLARCRAIRPRLRSSGSGLSP